MAEDGEESLIGYDPLAWMGETAEGKSAADNLSSHEVATAWTDVSPASVEIEAAEEVRPDTEEAFPLETAVGSNTDVSQITLESIQSIRNVAELHERLLRALDGSQKIEIDASAVSQIDTATMQLLLVLKQTAINLQREVVIDFPSERFIEAAQLLGLAEMLDVDHAAAGFF